MDVEIPARGTATVETGIKVSPPDDHYYTVEGRSSLWMQGIIPFRGIIDGTYQGPLKIVLMNSTTTPYQVHKGERVAQIIIHKTIHADFVIVDEFSPVEEGRQNNGFGSTGR
jgi:dUTP pyrophosphatase